MMVYKKLIDGLSAERNAILELYSDSLCYSTNKGTHAIQGNIKGTLVRWIIGEKMKGKLEYNFAKEFTEEPGPRFRHLGKNRGKNLEKMF